MNEPSINNDREMQPDDDNIDAQDNTNPSTKYVYDSNYDTLLCSCCLSNPCELTSKKIGKIQSINKLVNFLSAIV